MSHLFPFRNASLRALRSSSTVVTASKHPIYSNQICQHQQPYSYSTLSPPSLPNRISSTETNNTKSTKHTHAEQVLPVDSSQGSVYTFTRHFHTSPIFLSTINVTTPAFPESVKDGTIRLLKKVGDQVSADETIAEIETDKTNLSVNTPQAGVIEAFSVADGDTVTAGAQIAKLNTSADAKPSSDDKSTPKIDAEKSKTIPSKPTEPEQKPPSEKPVSQPTSTEEPKSVNPASKPQVSGLDPNKISGTRSETRVKMSRMRLKIAERLKEAQNTCAMLTTFNEIDMSNIVEFRKKFADQFAKRHNLKLGFMSAFVKASACALVDNPVVNAVIDGSEIVYRDYVDISVAVASPKGLVVPVLRNVEKMNFADIERAIGEFGEKVSEKGSLSIEDMDGGTFTISNGGVFGSLFGTPIINPPQTAILGMHGIFDRPVVVNGKMEIRPMMYVALTYDHRLIDGRDAVLFLRKVKQYVEDCRTIFLEL